MEISHYITLPCISHQKIESFETEIDKTFELQDAWNIALTEVSFPKAWYNIPLDQYVELLYFKTDEKYSIGVINSSECVIQKGDYTIEELIFKINEAFNRLVERNSDDVLNLKNNKLKIITNMPKLHLDLGDEYKGYVGYKFGIISKNEKIYPRFSECLGNLLGFGYNEMTQLAISTFHEYLRQKSKDPNKPLAEIDEINNLPGQKKYDLRII